MDDFKLVEEFLSKKSLDGVDKFLLEKYIEAIENILNYIKELEEKIEVCTDTGARLISTEFIKNNFINKQVIRDKIEELKKDKKFKECFPEDYMAEICINILKELLEEK